MAVNTSDISLDFIALGEPVQFKKLSPDTKIPTRATEFSAGFDLYAAEDTTIIGGMGNIVVPTGIAVQLPPGTYGRIAIRSGHAVRYHFGVSAGVIDRDYTGEIKVLVSCSKVYESKMIKNEMDDSVYVVTSTTAYYIKPYQYTIKKGERFAQLIVEKISYASAQEVNEFTTDYKDIHAGFGSTGRT